MIHHMTSSKWEKLLSLKTTDLGVGFDQTSNQDNMGFSCHSQPVALLPHPHSRGMIWETDQQTNRRIDLLSYQSR